MGPAVRRGGNSWCWNWQFTVLELATRRRRSVARFGLGEVTGPMRSMSRPDEIGRRWLLHTDRGRA